MSRLQPRPKSLATSNLSSQSRTTTTTKEPPSRTEPSTTRKPAPTSSKDAVSERVTISLIRRTLCSHLSDKGRSTPAPIDELLPPLTSSNEVDLQLYAFIAIIIREFVHTWYAKITPDHVFVGEVVSIIAHITRALEQRLRKVDLESLLFDELPELVDGHVRAYRTAQVALHPPPFQHNPRTIYHSVWPFPALSPIPDGDQDTKLQMENEAAYRQLLVQGVLAVLLPTEDLENDCLTALVGQIFSEMILGNGIGGKASEPWLLWEGITKIAEFVQSQLPNSKARVRLERSNSDLMDPGSLDLTGWNTKRWRFTRSVQKYFWLILQYGFLAFTAIRFFIMTVATASSLPSRMTPMKGATSLGKPTDHKEELNVINADATLSGPKVPLKQPVVQMKLWSCVSRLVDLEARMPWLTGTMSLLQWGATSGLGGVGKTDGMLDKILSHAISTHVLDATLLPPLLRTMRAALFPNNTLAPPRCIPAPSEQLLIRRRCAESLLGLLSGRVRDVFFGFSERSELGRTELSLSQSGEYVEDGEEKERRIKEVEEGILDVFSDAYCNRHLMYGVVELVIVRLIPELGERGVEELLGERLS